MSKNPFEQFKNLVTEEKTEDVQNQFMLNRIMSFQPLTGLTAIELNKYIGRLPYWAIDSLFNLTTPKRKRAPYINYPRRGKQTDKKLTEKIRQTLCVNEFHAKQIIELLRLKGKAPERLFGLREGE